jgi:hypothetical protein
VIQSLNPACPTTAGTKRSKEVKIIAVGRSESVVCFGVLGVRRYEEIVAAGFRVLIYRSMEFLAILSG